MRSSSIFPDFPTERALWLSLRGVFGVLGMSPPGWRSNAHRLPSEGGAKKVMVQLFLDAATRSTAQRSYEVVERKGLGHPDTICDAIAEEFSRRLCRAYRERFGGDPPPQRR